ncbi:MAG: hypothetical protein KDD53_09520 [Bdellovibrionales bacterium]|nr:hypothetical protein [Bdellovibrionales bacterium]
MAEAGLKSDKRGRNIRRTPVRQPITPLGASGTETVLELDRVAKGEKSSDTQEIEEVGTSQQEEEIATTLQHANVAQVEPKKREGEAPKKPLKKDLSWRERASGGHSLPRFEGRLYGDHPSILSFIRDKATRQTHKLNKEVNKSEILAGLIDLLRPVYKSIDFSNTKFERGQSYGPGAEKMRSEVALSFKRAVYEGIISAMLTGEDEVVNEILLSLHDDDRARLVVVLDETRGSASVVNS